MAEVNRLIVDTATPPIPEAQGWLAGYSGAYGPSVNLSQAVPGDPPPQSFFDRLSAAAALPEAAKYGDIFGDRGLRDAFAEDVNTLYGARISANETAITAGCNQAFFVSVMAVAKAGDAVLLPVPWYFNHKMTLDMLGIEARPLPLSAEEGFLPDAAQTAELVDGKVKAIVLVTPNNPTGAVYPDATLQAFRELCEARGIWLIVDETYRDFLPEGGKAPHSLFSAPAWQEAVISLYSFSKAYAIPGHRVGAIVASSDFVREAGKILDCVQISPPRVPQLALPWAIRELKNWREETRATILERIEAFRAALQPFPEWRIDQIGAYFAYLRPPFREVAARDVAAALARETGVLTLPGSYFGPGQENHLRVAFANVDAETLSGLGERFAAAGALSIPANIASK
ncbi:aminotransferase [Stappia sp. GBMRC 2046]|uniref:Aminotransferase n=1 Tax=Stappia sediminis TaxID=2692190 RepID=A0A7X3S8I2_9HYPH|nr:aminotransferase [Stappia sediminis]MXN65852.1 aminotransferase [Stappia sediminis]